jgi:DNA-binding NarL/FixJ family response regulator
MSVPKKWILAVDDDSSDMFWMETAIAGASEGDFSYHLSKATTPREARALLKAMIRDCEEQDEIIIFSDVNMPTKSGLQFLEWLKDQPAFNGIRVVIVSSFDRRAEVIRAYELGAVACMVKPPQAGGVKGLLRMIKGLSSGTKYMAEIVARRNGAIPAFITPASEVGHLMGHLTR